MISSYGPGNQENVFGIALSIYRNNKPVFASQISIHNAPRREPREKRKKKIKKS